jgi:hypothetical protein
MHAALVARCVYNNVKCVLNIIPHNHVNMLNSVSKDLEIQN